MRGLIKRIGSSYGDLISAASYNALGQPTQQRFGDTAETTTSVTYDPNEHWVTSSETTRQAPAIWTSPPTGYDPPQDGFGIPTTVRSDTFGPHDKNGNVLGIGDLRIPSEWPVGAKPVSRTVDYDAHFRVSGVSYQHGYDDQVSPFLAEEQASDPRPFPRTVTPTRVDHQLVAHDALGNLDVLVGDTGAVLERGFGSAQMSASAPHQVLQTLSTDGSHEVTPHYDEAGNIVGLDVARVATCSAPTGKCAQRFLFEWDEVGSLVRARRWDMYSLQDEPAYPAQPNSPAAAEARYRYSAGQRVHKESVEGASSSFTVDVFASLRLKNTSWNNVTGAYRVDADVASVDLGVARVISRPGLPSTTGNQHTLLFVPDHLGSTSTVIDKGTSEVAEMVTYLPHGGTESDFRPDRWQGLREDLRFAGREEDVEFGIIAMGVRAYSPLLGRFLSADPLTVHGVAGDINPYGYVGGSVLDLTDPSGLDWCILCHLPGGEGSSNRGDNGPGTDAPGASAPAQPRNPNPAAAGASSGGSAGGASPPAPPPPTYRPSSAPASGSGSGFTASLQAAGAAGRTALMRLEDTQVLIRSQAVAMGVLDVIPLSFMPNGPTVGSVLQAVGIKTDKRAENWERAAAVVAPFAFGAAGAAVERAAVSVTSVAKAPVAAYEVGTFESLAERSAVGDGLDLHHVGQAHAMEQAVAGYSRRTAPTIALPRAEHAQIPNLKGPVSLTARQLLARDIRNLRNFTNAPNSSLRRLIQLNKELYPEAFAK